MNIFDILSNVQTAVIDCVDAACLAIAKPSSRLVDEFTKGIQSEAEAENNNKTVDVKIFLRPTTPAIKNND